MPIEKGADWGELAPLPAKGVIAATDRDASLAIEAAWAAGTALPAIGLVGGDLRRGLGGRRDAAGLREPDCLCVDIDVGEVVVGGVRRAFVAHLVARRSWWRGPVIAVMNTDWFGGWNVAPRAHPGDAAFDVVHARSELPFGQRVKARSRLPLGTHVPHPLISALRQRGGAVDLGAELDVWVDGERVGRARELVVELHSAALRVHA